MVRITLSTLALTLGVAAAISLVSCGGRDEEGLLPGETADEIVANLDQVEAEASSGDCSSAAAEVGTIQQQIDALPNSVDPQLRARLTQGAQRLADVVNSAGACETTTIETTTEPTSTEETTEPTTEKEKTESTTTTPTTTTTTSSTTAPVLPPSETGGTPGGVNAPRHDTSGPGGGGGNGD